jgi:hypothetical protein
MMKSSERLQNSTVGQVARSIVLAIVVMALVLAVVDMYKQRREELVPAGSDRSTPSYYFIDALA